MLWHELPELVVHVDATQPLFEDIIAQLIPKMVGSKDVGNPFGLELFH